MLKRIFGAFGKKPVVVKGTGKLEEGQARTVTIGDPLAGSGYELVFCRVDGELFALDAKCPHQGGRITAGPLADGKYAVCPLHHYQFDPKTGDVKQGSCAKAKTYRVREVGDDCEIWL